MISNIEDYFAKGCGRCPRFATPECSVKKFRSGLAKLRKICLSLNLKETVKWGQPCYMSSNRNIVILGAFQDKFLLSFFEASLMKNKQKVLVKQGPNSRHADTIYFTNTKQVLNMEKTIRSYLKEAIGYAKKGLKAQKVAPKIELPKELLEAMENDLKLKKAFHKLTPGRQRSYVINLNSAKKKDTRILRIKKFRSKILAGKGALER